MRSERGFTIVEVLVAALLLVVGIGATIASFVGPQEQTLVAQRLSQASALAERELEELTTRPFAVLGMRQMPAPVSDASDSPTDPRAHLRAPASCGDPSASNATCLLVRQNFNRVADGRLAGTVPSGEPLVGASKGVEPKEIVNGMTVHRFVSWQDRDPCALNIRDASVITQLLNGLLNVLGGFTDKLADSVKLNRLNLLCLSGNAVKRVTVAVTAPPAGNQAGPIKPVWMSTLVPNPGAGVFNQVGVDCVKVLVITSCNPL